MILLNFIEFCKRRKDLVALVAIIFLLCLLSFGLGFLINFYLQKPPLIIENPAGE